MRTVTVAENAGFCFGVKRATDCLEDALKNARAGEKIYTLGHLIHNETYNESLRRRGVGSTGLYYIFQNYLQESFRTCEDLF